MLKNCNQYPIQKKKKIKIKHEKHIKLCGLTKATSACGFLLSVPSTILAHTVNDIIYEKYIVSFAIYSRVSGWQRSNEFG